MKRILAFIFRWALVYTEDYDGTARLRKVKSTPFNSHYVRGIYKIVGKLEANGKISRGDYLEHWMPANKKGKAIWERINNKRYE